MRRPVNEVIAQLNALPLDAEIEVTSQYVLKRDDGAYYWGHYRGNASTIDSLLNTPKYALRGAKSARGWLRDKERWSIVPVNVTITEVSANG